jgi:hypothetical protein
MTSRLASSIVRESVLSLCAGALVALVACRPGVAEAGAQNMPCRNPFVFPDAAVNVVVLPYEAPPGIATVGGMGERLSGLLQLEVLRSIAKFGSVGAVQMVGAPADCDPEVVVAKLLGRAPGAQTTLRKGQGLVAVWGRFYSEGGNVFVQTFCRLLRSGVDETFDLVVGGQPFSGQLSAQAFACAPRKVTIEDIGNFEQQFARSTIVRSEPNDAASGIRMTPEPLPYWISDTQGDWMKIDARMGGVRGWIHLGGARDTWSLARWLPELTYIEGMVGYLRYTIAAQQSAPTRPAWIESAMRALVEYEQSFAPQPGAVGAAPSLPWRTALAGAVQLQLRGVLTATKPDATDADRLNAMRLFDRAAVLLPHDANARNLAAIMGLSLALGPGHPELSPKQMAADLLQALGAEPGNHRVLANLQSAYRALLAPPAVAGVALSEDERRSFNEQLAAMRQIR